MGLLTKLRETPACNEKAVNDWPEMKKRSVKRKPREESTSGKDLGTLSNAAERLKKSKTSHVG